MRLIPVSAGFLAVGGDFDAVPGPAALGVLPVFTLAPKGHKRRRLCLASMTVASTMLTSPALMYKPLADSCRLTSSSKVSSKPCLVSVLRNRQGVLWSGTPSLKPKLMKRRNIKSRASCFSRPGPLKPYQHCSNKP